MLKKGGRGEHITSRTKHLTYQIRKNNKYTKEALQNKCGHKSFYSCSIVKVKWNEGQSSQGHESKE